MTRAGIPVARSHFGAGQVETAIEVETVKTGDGWRIRNAALNGMRLSRFDELIPRSALPPPVPNRARAIGEAVGRVTVFAIVAPVLWRALRRRRRLRS